MFCLNKLFIQNKIRETSTNHLVVHWCYNPSAWHVKIAFKITKMPRSSWKTCWPLRNIKISSANGSLPFPQ